MFGNLRTMEGHGIRQNIKVNEGHVCHFLLLLSLATHGNQYIIYRWVVISQVGVYNSTYNERKYSIPLY